MMLWQQLAANTLLFMFGPMALLASIFVVNRVLTELDQDERGEVQHFEVEAIKPPKANVVQAPPKAAKPQPAKPQLKPDLSQILAGSSYGIESLSGIGSETLSEKLIDDFKDTAMTAATVEDPPKILRQVPLAYPEEARKLGIKGSVTMNILVAASGAVQTVKILSSSPAGMFDALVLDGVRQWQFQPGMNRGKAVAVWVEQTVQFSLN